MCWTTLIDFAALTRFCIFRTSASSGVADPAGEGADRRGSERVPAPRRSGGATAGPCSGARERGRQIRRASAWRREGAAARASDPVARGGVEEGRSDSGVVEGAGAARGAGPCGGSGWNGDGWLGGREGGREKGGQGNKGVVVGVQDGL
uniref:DUF834 domain-containing protein n=1 Tax=Setaria viridis TaxID=4556 RepID=A0A4U6TJW9_SETVI|nr:hypothetical protein SEVIR_8G166900v2 [Setaria viridis]